MASSWSEENVNLNYFQHWRCQGVCMSCNFSGHWWVSGNNYQCFIWQMLLPFVADVVATIDVGRCYCQCWLMLLPIFCGWCYCHFLVIGRCFSHILADVIAIILFINGTMLADVVAILWLMLLPLCCWQMLLPCLADVIAIVFVVDGTNYTAVAIVVPHCGSIVFLWQILLPGLADVIAICCCVAGVIATMADVIAIFYLIILGHMLLCGRCHHHYGWCYCHFFLSCCVGQMLFARVADGIAYPGGCGVWCYDHVWQME